MAESAEHIFQVYLLSNNKNITKTHNINTDKKIESIAITENQAHEIESLKKNISDLTRKMDYLFESQSKHVPLEKISHPNSQHKLLFEDEDNLPEEIKPPVKVKPEKVVHSLSATIKQPSTVAELDKIVLDAADKYQDADKRAHYLNSLGIMKPIGRNAKGGYKPWDK
jgi:hypothetical protein